MAIRLENAVIRGEIDNTSPGNVRGKVWLVGRAEPLILDLRGDAWRDVAGSRIIFTNPNPEAQAVVKSLAPKQSGFVGDITASRKVEAPDETADLDALVQGQDAGTAARLRNSLYLEWFSEENGRVFIESAEFEVSVSEWMWEMDEAREEAQKMTNLHAMRGWLAGIIRRPEPKDEEDDDTFDDSEESWEESMKLSDRLGDAHMEALEKYGIEALDDDRIAFVMGWDHMLGGVDELPVEGVDEDDEGDEWKDGGVPASDYEPGEGLDPEGGFLEPDDPDSHPLHRRSYQLMLRVLTELEGDDNEGAGADDRVENTALDRFIRSVMNISGKLAGALGFRGHGGSSHKGYTLAILRRCLNWANEALAALNELTQNPAWQDRETLLAEFRAELFALRDGMTDLRRELRER